MKPSKPSSWAEHFKQCSRRPLQEPTFNGFFDTALDYVSGGANSHSAQELADLLAAKKSEIDDFASHIAAMRSNASPEWVAWSTDWGNFAAAWQRVYADAARTVEADRYSILGMGQSETDKYNAVLTFLQPQGPGSSILQALYNRYTALPKSTAVPFRPVPQPSQTSSEKAYVQLDRTAQSMPGFVKASVGLVAPDLVPKTADQKNYDPAKYGKEVLKDHWKGIAIAGVGLVVALKVLMKVGL